MACRVTQDGQVMVESSDKMWSTGEGNGKPLQYSCLENPMNSMKRQKNRTLNDELPRLVGAHYATGDQRRNNSRKNEEMESEQKQHPVVDVTGNRSKVWCCKEQYCIWESHFLGRLIGSLGVPNERGVWNSQGGRKDKLFLSPHSLGLYNNNVSCLRTVFGLNLLLS